MAERHLATLTTLRGDGAPHTVPVGFTYDGEAAMARVITGGGSVKVRNVRARNASRVTLCQVDGRRWLTLEGTATIQEKPDAVADAERRYAQRYRDPRPNPTRVVLQVQVERVLGGRWLVD
jgi:PPOX class probable F420-dependent enzyme